jgi:glutaredoxin
MEAREGDSYMSQVEIFTKPGCPYCAAAKEDFQRKGINFVEHNVKASRDALRRMVELNGGLPRVPTIVQGSEVTVGFRGY